MGCGDQRGNRTRTDVGTRRHPRASPITLSLSRQPSVEAAEAFAIFSKPLLANNPMYLGVNWSPLVPDAQRVEYEDKMTVVREFYIKRDNITADVAVGFHGNGGVADIQE